MGNTVIFEMKVPFRVDKEGDFYVASCPPLDVVSQGDTEQKARDNLKEALTLFVETAYEMGTLHQVLIDCGLTPRGEEVIVDADEISMLDVPLCLIARDNRAENYAH